MAKFLQRRGFLEADEESNYLTLETSEDEAMQQLYGHSIGGHKQRAHPTKLSKIASNHLSMSDLSAEPALKAALLAAYRLGQKKGPTVL